MSRKTRNKTRFYVYECPTCGRHVEFLMDLRKHDKVYVPPECEECQCTMRRKLNG